MVDGVVEINAIHRQVDSRSWIELRLSPGRDGGTRFELDHITLVADDDKWAQFGPGAVGVGWEPGLMGLALHPRSGAAVDPAQARAWSASEPGRRFASLSSQRWRDADVAAGRDPSEADAAGERTAAFYTGASLGTAS